MNSNIDKLFGKRKMVGYFITIYVIMRKDDVRETVVKGNNGGKWSSDGMMLWLGRMQNGDTVEWWRE
jgi:hypothetical protein